MLRPNGLEVVTKNIFLKSLIVKAVTKKYVKIFDNVRNIDSFAPKSKNNSWFSIIIEG
jgi:hypothetical protein